MYLPMRSQMSSIMEQIKPEHPELFALEFGKIAETDFAYTLSSPNINQSAPNLVKMYVAIRSRMSSIMNFIRAELFELFALEFAKIAESDFVYSLASTNAVFFLGRGIAGIPHFCKKSPKLSDTVRDKSPTLNHVAIIFKIRLIFHTLGR